MKKARILIVALVCAVMLMGVGYAYWTDAITFTGTVGTGKMDVIWTAANAVASDTGSVAVVSASPDAGGKNVTFSFTNAYPGAEATITGSFKNDGTIPVKLVSLASEITTGSAGLYAALQGKTATTGWDSIDNCLAAATASLPKNVAKDETVALPTIYLRVNPAITNLDNLEDSNVTFKLTGNFQQFNQP